MYDTPVGFNRLNDFGKVPFSANDKQSIVQIK